MDLQAVIATFGELGERLQAWRDDAAMRRRLSDRELKLVADRQAHEFLNRRLAELDPSIPVVSEEDASHPEARPDRYWLIDPIDGTASWLGGYDGYVTQGALIEGTDPTVGVVVAPELGLTYFGHRARGAFLNGVEMTKRPTGAGDLKPIMIDNTPEPHGVTEFLTRSLGLSGYVESGSLGLKACRVADGTADLFVKDVVVRDWDMAPAAVILGEVGACLTLADGTAFPFRGAFEKPSGVIVARDDRLVVRTVAALQGREAGVAADGDLASTD